VSTTVFNALPKEALTEGKSNPLVDENDLEVGSRVGKCFN